MHHTNRRRDCCLLHLKNTKFKEWGPLNCGRGWWCLSNLMFISGFIQVTRINSKEVAKTFWLFIIIIYLCNHKYFKLWVLLDLTKVYTIRLQRLENLSLWQSLNYFLKIFVSHGFLTPPLKQQVNLGIKNTETYRK